MIPASFFVLAAWFLFGADDGMPELEWTPAVPAEAISTAPPRTILSDPPLVRIGGYDQRCSDCHALFDSASETPPALKQHEDIVLDHGLNDRCLNCHSTKDRDKLVLHGEREIGYDAVVDLCAKCHGPTFRDWERGVHGKTLGSWEIGSAAARRLLCTECHDPHAPAFPAYEPLPGPRTLRTPRAEERPAHHAPDPSDVSPLMRWLETSGRGAHGERQGEPKESGQ